MPDTLEKQDPTVTPETTPTEGDGSGSPEGSQQPYVTLEQFQSFRDELMGSLGELRGRASAQPEPQQAAPPPPPPPIDEPTEDEIAAAYDSGEPREIAKIQKRLHNAGVERNRRHVDEQVGQMREWGVTRTADLTRQLATKELEYYDRYKDEIDTFLGTLPPDVRANPEAYKYAHDIVVGRHIGELREEAVTQSRQPSAPQAQIPNGRTGRAQHQRDENEVPQPEDLHPEAQQALDYMGIDADKFARNLGYESWDDYMKREESPVAGNTQQINGAVRARG